MVLHVGHQMSDEYVFASSLDEAVAFAKAQGWRKAGRGGFIKPDGITVHFLCFEDQLQAIAPGMIVHDARGGGSARRRQ